MLSTARSFRGRRRDRVLNMPQSRRDEKRAGEPLFVISKADGDSTRSRDSRRGPEAVRWRCETLLESQCVIARAVETLSRAVDLGTRIYRAFLPVRWPTERGDHGPLHSAKLSSSV